MKKAREDRAARPDMEAIPLGDSFAGTRTSLTVNHYGNEKS